MVSLRSRNPPSFGLEVQRFRSLKNWPAFLFNKNTCTGCLTNYRPEKKGKRIKKSLQFPCLRLETVKYTLRKLLSHLDTFMRTMWNYVSASHQNEITTLLLFTIGIQLIDTNPGKAENREFKHFIAAFPERFLFHKSIAIEFAAV
jgi:hypothetical protein